MRKSLPQQVSKRAPVRKRKKLDIEPVDEFVGYHIRKAQLAVYDDFMSGQRTQPPMTPGQFSVLMLIEQNPDMSQQALCGHMAVDKSTMAVALHRLSRRGLIERVRSTQDRRQNGLRLTPVGARVLRDMRRYVQQHERRITARLSARECRQLITLLGKVG